MSTLQRISISTRGERDRFALRREYKNMCLSPQSARLRSDLHEKTKTCFRGILSFLSTLFFSSVSMLLLILVAPTHSALCTLHAECERGERKSWLSETRAVLCILQWQRYYVKRLRARAPPHTHTHTHALSFSLKRPSKFLDFTVHAFVNCFREWFSYILLIVVPRLFLL